MLGDIHTIFFSQIKLRKQNIYALNLELKVDFHLKNNNFFGSKIFIKSKGIDKSEIV